MFAEFSRVGLEDWLNLYTEADLTDFFQNYVVVLNHNERHVFDSMVQLTPVSSGFHIGASNWVLEVAQLKLSVITNLSSNLSGVNYRHPMPFNGAPLANADCLLLTSVVLSPERPPFDTQIHNLLNKLNQCLHSNLNAKVLMPVQPHFILEIMDILLHKLDERVKIIYMSEAA